MLGATHLLAASSCSLEMMAVNRNVGAHNLFWDVGGGDRLLDHPFTRSERDDLSLK